MIGYESIVRTYIRWAIRERGRLDVQAIARIWPIAVGNVWGERTRPIGLSGTNLEVAVPDSVWLNELRFQKAKILLRLNRLLPDDVQAIESLRLSVGNAPHWEPPERGEEQREVQQLPPGPKQVAALETIEDLELRMLVERVVGMDAGRRQRDRE